MVCEIFVGEAIYQEKRSCRVQILEGIGTGGLLTDEGYENETYELKRSATSGTPRCAFDSRNRVHTLDLQQWDSGRFHSTSSTTTIIYPTVPCASGFRCRTIPCLCCITIGYSSPTAWTDPVLEVNFSISLTSQ